MLGGIAFIGKFRFLVSVEGKTLGGKEEKAFTTDDWEKMSMQSPGEEENQFIHPLLGKDENAFIKPLLGKDENAFIKPLLEKDENAFIKPLLRKDDNAFNKPFTDESIHLFTSIAMELA
jgi:hypothetical protein